MKKKLIIVGGFLGAGKTTSIICMANHFMQSGLKIGIVTNDQGNQLVDTHFMRANGLEVLAVEGGCFCCNFGEFTTKVAELRQSKDIDVLLAEPVGSCTDLVATIFKPLLRNMAPMLGVFDQGFSLAPLSIVVDPKRVMRLMMQQDGAYGEVAGGAAGSGAVGGGAAGGGATGDAYGGVAGGAAGDSTAGGAGNIRGSAFPTEVNYLFDKQLQEANIIAINKCDILPADELKRIEAFIMRQYPGVEVLRVSAKTGEGLPKWIDRIMLAPYALSDSLQIDYDAYARAEASLGWLNVFYFLSMDKTHPSDINGRARAFINDVRAALSSHRAEIAHIKVFCVGQNEFYKASLTGIHDDLEESSVMLFPQSEANLIINARVNIVPDMLRRICDAAVQQAFSGFTINIVSSEDFRPSPPNPTYRIVD